MPARDLVFLASEHFKDTLNFRVDGVFFLPIDGILFSPKKKGFCPLRLLADIFPNLPDS